MQVLEEFYEMLSSVSVSALTGEGIDELFAAADRCRAEYMADYKPDLDRRRAVGMSCTCSSASCCVQNLTLVHTGSRQSGGRQAGCRVGQAAARSLMSQCCLLCLSACTCTVCCDQTLNTLYENTCVCLYLLHQLVTCQ